MSATLFIFCSLDQNRPGQFANTGNDDQHGTGEIAHAFESNRVVALGGLPAAALAFYNLLVPRAFMWMLAISI